MTAFSNLLREKRQEKGLTQRQLAARLEIDHTWISHLESGKKRPSRVLIQEIAKILDLDVDELLVTANYLPRDIRQLILQNCKAVGCQKVRTLMLEVQHDNRNGNDSSVPTRSNS